MWLMACWNISGIQMNDDDVVVDQEEFRKLFMGLEEARAKFCPAVMAEMDGPVWHVDSVTDTRWDLKKGMGSNRYRDQKDMSENQVEQRLGEAVRKEARLAEKEKELALLRKLLDEERKILDRREKELDERQAILDGLERIAEDISGGVST